MERLISIKLNDHPNEFPLKEDAYELLQGYLDKARLRLRTDPDGDEVMRDIERSIADRLADLINAGSGRIDSSNVQATLDAIGTVETGDGLEPHESSLSTGTRGRFLCRITEDQWLAGVCTGLAAYSDIDLGWVRTIFLALVVGTGGIFALVYFVMMFALPVVPTLAEYVSLRDAPIKTAR